MATAGDLHPKCRSESPQTFLSLLLTLARQEGTLPLAFGRAEVPAELESWGPAAGAGPPVVGSKVALSPFVCDGVILRWPCTHTTHADP